MPLGIALLFLIGTILLVTFKKRKASFVLLVSLTLWLWLWSTPIWCDFLKLRLESQFAYKPAESYPVADAIISLGGGIRGDVGPDFPSLDLGQASDRDLFAAQLYKAGRSNKIIVSGGVDPLSRAGSMGLAQKHFIEMLGVPADSILVEGNSRNTIENAKEVEKLMQPVAGKSILLVTSAQHMPRSYWLFARTGLKVIPAPTDFEATNGPFTIHRLLPNAGALEASTNAWKEYIGLWVSKMAKP